jgi:hypothetical protein
MAVIGCGYWGKNVMATSPSSEAGKDVMVCPESGWRCCEIEPGVLRCLGRPDDEPLVSWEVPTSERSDFGARK